MRGKERAADPRCEEERSEGPRWAAGHSRLPLRSRGTRRMPSRARPAAITGRRPPPPPRDSQDGGGGEGGSRLSRPHGGRRRGRAGLRWDEIRARALSALPPEPFTARSSPRGARPPLEVRTAGLSPPRGAGRGVLWGDAAGRALPRSGAGGEEARGCQRGRGGRRWRAGGWGGAEAAVTFRWAAVGGGKLSPFSLCPSPRGSRQPRPGPRGSPRRGAGRAVAADLPCCTGCTPAGRGVCVSPDPRVCARSPNPCVCALPGSPLCVPQTPACLRSPDPRVCACPPNPCADFPRSTAASAGIAQWCSAPRCVFLSRLSVRQPGLSYTWINAARWTRW